MAGNKPLRSCSKTETVKEFPTILATTEASKLEIGTGKSDLRYPCPARSSSGRAKSPFATNHKEAAWDLVMVGKRSNVQWVPKDWLDWQSMTHESRNQVLSLAAYLLAIWLNPALMFLNAVVLSDAKSVRSFGPRSTRMLFKDTLGNLAGQFQLCTRWSLRTATM